MAKHSPFSFADLYNTLVGGFAPLGKGPLGQRASIETQLQYGPTLQALVQLGQQTSQQYRQNVKGIRRGGFAASQGIGQVAQDFNGLLGATPAPTSEAAGRLGLTRDAVSGSLARMQAQQLAGVSSGVQRARSEFQSGRQDIIGQMLQAAQKGALYNQGQYAGYANDASKAREARTQWETEQRLGLVKQGINPDTMRYDPKLSAPKAQSVNAYGYSDRQWASMSPADRRAAAKQWNTQTRAPSSSGSKGPTRAETRDRIERYAKVRDRIQGAAAEWNRLSRQEAWITPEGELSLTKVEGAKPFKPPRDFLIGRLEKKYDDLPPIERRAAIEFAIFNGNISVETRRALQRRYKGLQLPKAWHGSSRRGERIQNVLDFG